MRIALFTALLSSAVASAESVSTQVDEPTPAPAFEISLKAGGHFPQLVNSLGTSFDGILKVGYAPFESRRFQLFADLGFSQPRHSFSATDPRLGTDGGAYGTTVVVKDLAATVGAQYFLLDPREHLVPYVGLGVRTHFIRAETTGATSTPFGEYVETDTRVGGVAYGGVGFHLGPGLLLGELAFGYAPVDERVTGTTNIGALSVLLGYGLLL